jgi:hypothetical protein
VTFDSLNIVFYFGKIQHFFEPKWGDSITQVYFGPLDWAENTGNQQLLMWQESLC